MDLVPVFRRHRNRAHFRLFRHQKLQVKKIGSLVKKGAVVVKTGLVVSGGIVVGTKIPVVAAVVKIGAVVKAIPVVNNGVVTSVVGKPVVKPTPIVIPPPPPEPPLVYVSASAGRVD